MPIESLLRHFATTLPLDEAEQRELTARTSVKKLRRRQFLLEAGDVCQHYHFVASGCLRMYLLDDRGTEHVLQFATEGWWITDIGSFHGERPSRLSIDALEPSEVLRIRKDDLLYLYEHFPKFDRHFRVLVENAFVKMQQRLLQTISSTAEERYLTFLDNYPALSNHIPQLQIASYIGVTPEFLSKIRKNLMRK